jgi:hypothetical protein
MTRFIGRNAASIAFHGEIANQHTLIPSVSFGSPLPDGEVLQRSYLSRVLLLTLGWPAP